MKKTSIITICILICAIVIILATLPRHHNTESDGEEKHVEIKKEKTLATGQEGKQDKSGLRHWNADKQRPELNLTDNEDTEIQRLQEFLDDNDTDNILAQCSFLVESDSAARRYSAIGALEWVDEPKAGIILSRLLKDPVEEVAEYAQSAMETLMDKMLTSITDDSETQELVSEKNINEYFDMCTTAIKNSANGDAADQLMSKIDGLDPKLSIPILLDILENGSKNLRDITLEHLNHVSNGNEIKNREEAMLWLMKDQNVLRKDQE